MKGKFLLYSELILIILLFYFGNLGSISKNPVLSIIFAAGLILGVWSLYNLGLDTYTPFPEPRREGKHVQEGAYKYIRHPIYTATAMITFALLLANPSFPAAVIYLLLIFVLDQKASLEEKYLAKLHPTYNSYTQKTKKFIPLFY